MDRNMLNQFTSSIEANEGFSRHPQGTFNAAITKVVKSWNDNLKKDAYDIHFVTEHGMPPTMTIFDFNDQDMRELQTNQARREGIQKAVGRLKFMLSNVLSISKDQMDRLNWDQMLSLLGKLTGKGVEIFVGPDKKNSQYDRTYINGPSQGASQVQEAPAAQFAPPDGIVRNLMDATRMDQRSSPPQQAWEPPRQSLDDIPF